MQKNCLSCGKSFIIYGRQIFCSKECPKRNKRCICAACKTPFLSERKVKFCSSKCGKLNSKQRAASRRNKKPIRVALCLHCGGEFQTNHHSKITCSAKCAKSERAEKNRQTVWISKKCCECGNEFRPFGNLPNILTCSKKCSRARYNKNRQKWQSHRYHSDPAFRLGQCMKQRIYKVLRPTSLKKAGRKTIAMIGCSIEFLREHLQQKFKEGMAWNNYGTHWQVDHILPISSFNLNNPEHQRKVFHYSNLQPLWAMENLAKSNKIL